MKKENLSLLEFIGLLAAIALFMFGITAVAALLGGCAAPEYRLVRAERSEGAITYPALYEKRGDAGHVYIKSLDGESWIALPK